MAFGLAHTARYGVLFSEHAATGTSLGRNYCKPVAFGPDGAPVLEFGAETFALLVDALAQCVAAGRSASTDAMADSTAIWVALHGTVSLKSSAPGFPWPESGRLRSRFVLRLGPHHQTVPRGLTLL